MMEDFTAWTILLQERMPITISRRYAQGLPGVALYLKEHGIQAWEIVGVLRSVSKAQGRAAAQVVKTLMEMPRQEKIGLRR